MRAEALRQLLSAVGLIAWGVLLVAAAWTDRISVLNFRWEGKQPQVRSVATKATLVIGVLSIAIGALLGIGAFVL